MARPWVGGTAVRRRVVSTLVLIVLVVSLPLALVDTGASAQSPRALHDWVGSWAAAVTPADAERPAEQRFANTTLRQVVHLSVGGEALRVRLTNVYGFEPLEVGAVTVGVRGHGARGTAQPGEPLVPVHFDDRPAVTVPAGAEWVSDPVDVAVPDDADLVISLYLPDFDDRPSVHFEAVATTFSAPGDATGAGAAAFAPLNTSWYFLDGVDVRTRASGSVVAFGDSITDGVQSVVDANHRYPDVLADRLLRRTGLPRRMGVLNAGLSANRLLSDAGLGGESALARFERDVLGQTGVVAVIVLMGINDIHNSDGQIPAEDLIAVHRQLVQRGHDAGLQMVGGTILPYEGAPRYTPEGEAVRQEVNEWILESGVYDAVVDFDAVLRDPAHPTRLLPEYDTGDHVHPNDAGLAAMGRAVRLADLKPHRRLQSPGPPRTAGSRDVGHATVRPGLPRTPAYP